METDTADQNTGSEVAKTTCYMCACRCGIDVHLRTDDKGVKHIRFIEGNRDHPVNKGVLCAKGSAGIMQQNSPARLNKPLRRVGPRGSSEFEEISWDEAMDLAVSWLAPIRANAPEKLAFFTGRDQSQSLTSWWAQQYGTPNYAAHGGFCSVNMAAAGIYTIGGSFWEFGSPDWDRTRLLMLFGVAEDHDSNPIKMGLAKLKQRGARTISINPVRTGYSAIADEWIGIRPGHDGLFVLALIHELFRMRKIDLDYLVRYTNAPWLVIDNPGGADHGLFARDEAGNTLVWDRVAKVARSSAEIVARPELTGKIVLPDGRKASPVLALMGAEYFDMKYAPEAVAERIGISSERIRAIAQELARVAFEEEITLDQPWTDWKGERHETMIGRPVSMHAMRGISAHSNGFQTCRSIHLLQLLLGSIDCPGGFRYKPPYPKPPEAHPSPSGHHATPDRPLHGPHLGYPRGPQDLLLGDDGSPVRIDKAFSWEAPLAVHGLMHMVISNAVAGDPYRIDTLMMYMANMAWNSSMNTGGTMDMLTAKDDETGEYKIPHIIYSDAYASEMVHYADLVLPDTTYLERHDCMSLLDRPICEPDLVADSIRHPVLEPDREVRGFQTVLIDLGARLGLPGFVDENNAPEYRDYADYLVRHQRKPGIGPLAGFRGVDGDKAGRGEPNPRQLERYIEEGSFWTCEVPQEARYYKFANRAWHDFSVDMGFTDKPTPVVHQLYSEILQSFVIAADGHGEHQPPDHLRERVRSSFSPLPRWYAPLEDADLDVEEFPLHAVTQRPMAMYHSWGSQNAWLRQIHTVNPLFVPALICDEMGLADGDWVWAISQHGRIHVPVRRMEAVNSDTVWTWNAIGKRSGTWNLAPDAPEARKGFLLNHLIHELLPAKGDGKRRSNSDPVTGQAAWYDLRLRLEKAEPPPDETSFPQFETLGGLPGMPMRDKVLRYGTEWLRQRSRMRGR
jgi:anaerobic selenocysteine-containing dehydrogenase